MTQFWRIRLGEAVGYQGNEIVYNLCKNEKPPCIAIGWGKIDLSKSINQIRSDYENTWGLPLRKNEDTNINRWIGMKKGDCVVVMIVPATICAIGKIVNERYHKVDNNFKLNIIGGPGYTKDHPYGEVLFFNRIDVEWIKNPDNYIKVKSLGLPKDLEAKLHIPMTIINLYRNEYNILINKINMHEPEEDSSTPKYGRKYDNYGKSDR